jgi:hypothetical protein
MVGFSSNILSNDMHREERLIPNYDQTHAVPDASFSQQLMADLTGMVRFDRHGAPLLMDFFFRTS